MKYRKSLISDKIYVFVQRIEMAEVTLAYFDTVWDRITFLVNPLSFGLIQEIIEKTKEIKECQSKNTKS